MEFAKRNPTRTYRAIMSSLVNGDILILKLRSYDAKDATAQAINECRARKAMNGPPILRLERILPFVDGESVDEDLTSEADIVEPAGVAL